MVYRNLKYLRVLPFQIIFSQTYDFTTRIFNVPMWSSEVANFKTEIHLTNAASEVTWACHVTTIEREGDFTSLVICYCFW